MTADRALELGLLNRVVDDGSVLTEALALAAVIAANAPLAVQATKSFVRDSDRFGSDWDDEVWQQNEATVMPIFTTEDAREGAVAFAAKRAPVWRGR
ncbi:MAG: enoyl-CoA hydratase-related protein [Nakamurella sp.]